MASTMDGFINYYCPIVTKAFWTEPLAKNYADAYTPLFWIAAFLYMPLTYLGQRLMANRKPFVLTNTIFAWNMFLSIFSGLCAGCIFYNDGHVLGHLFFEQKLMTVPSQICMYLFTFSKILEYGDTLFLVLRKKPLIFLHLYHHLSVTIFTWHAQSCLVNFAHYFVVINLSIHTIMYFYYAMQAICTRRSLLRAMRPFVTGMQTLQMFVGMYMSYNATLEGNMIPEYVNNAYFAMVMYTSFAYLFAQFYMENYFKHLRCGMTILVCTLHVMAVIGAWNLWNHSQRSSILVELLILYSITVLLLWLIKDPSISSNNVKPWSSKEMKEDTTEMSSLTYHSNENSQLRSIARIIIMFLNCVASWATEQDMFLRKLRQMRRTYEYCLTSVTKSKVEHSENDKNQRKSKESSYQSDEGSSIFKSLLEKTNDSNVINTKNVDINSSENKTHQSEYNKNTETLPSRPFDLWLSLMCFGIPAIYSYRIYHDLVLGMCTLGALRWVIELHTIQYVYRDNGTSCHKKKVV